MNESRFNLQKFKKKGNVLGLIGHDLKLDHLRPIVRYNGDGLSFFKICSSRINLC